MARNQITYSYGSVYGTTDLTVDVLAWRHEGRYRVRVDGAAGAGTLVVPQNVFATISKDTSFSSREEWRLHLDSEVPGDAGTGHRTFGDAIHAAALQAWFIVGNSRQVAEEQHAAVVAREVASREKRDDESYAGHALRNGGSLLERIERRVAVSNEVAPVPYQHVIISQGHRADVAPAVISSVLSELLRALRAELIVGPVVEYRWADADDTLTFTVQAGYWSRQDAQRAQDVLVAGVSHLQQASVRRSNLVPHADASNVEFAATIADNAYRART